MWVRETATGQSTADGTDWAPYAARVPAEITPADLACLVEFAERPRTQKWSLRAALVRYAQPAPQRVNDVLDLVRRAEWALGQHSAVLQRDGATLWDGLERDATPSADEHVRVVGLLRAVRELDVLGDVLADWASDISGGRPDAAVDATIADVSARLDAVGVPHEERTPPTRSRRRTRA